VIVPIQASVLDGWLGIGALAVALLTALVGVLSFYFNSAHTSKQTLLQQGLDAYKAVVAWKVLLERAERIDKLDLDDIWMRLFDAREATAYHQAFMYGQSRHLGKKYHILSEVVRGAYEPAVIAILEPAEENRYKATQADIGPQPAIDRARRDYLAELKRSASYYRVLRNLRILRPFGDPPEWL